MKSYACTKIQLSSGLTIGKTYLTSYFKDGYEAGVGVTGTYRGHSHRNFYDIIYSPGGIVHSHCRGVLMIVPPRTYMEDIILCNFFFLKFSPDSQDFKLPEKTDEMMSEGKLTLYDHEGEFRFPIYTSPKSKPSEVIIRLNKKQCSFFLINREYQVSP